MDPLELALAEKDLEDFRVRTKGQNAGLAGAMGEGEEIDEPELADISA
jgi:hypothetical protein